MISRRTLALAAALVFSLAPALADDYPSRPITMVVGLGAGGGQDINTRIYADAMSRILGKQIVVENRTGAGGAIAAAYVQNAAPDGYTLITVSGLQHAYLPASGTGHYEPVKGFTPISTMFEIISMLSIPASNPAKNVAEWIDYAKKKPTPVLVGAPGLGSPPHMLGALIGEKLGVKVEPVQYRGSMQAMADLAGGRTDFAFPTYTIGAPFIADKKIRPLAVAADKRWSQYPDMPTLVEAGLVKHMVAMWFGLLAPHDTPAPIVAKLNDAVAKASRDPELVKRMSSTGTGIRISKPEEMRSLMVTETSNVESMIKRLGLRQ